VIPGFRDNAFLIVGPFSASSTQTRLSMSPAGSVFRAFFIDLIIFNL
jgi:hypothetical protein